MKVEPKTLPGFMELLPQEQILFNQMKEKIKNSYEKFGFLQLIHQSSKKQRYYLQKLEEKQKNKFIDLIKEKMI